MYKKYRVLFFLICGFSTSPTVTEEKASCTMNGRIGQLPWTVCSRVQKLLEYAHNKEKWSAKRAEWLAEKGTGPNRLTLITGKVGRGKSSLAQMIYNAAGISEVVIVNIGGLEHPAQLIDAIRKIQEGKALAEQRARENNCVVGLIIDEIGAPKSNSKKPNGLMAIWSLISLYVSDPERDPRIDVTIIAEDISHLSAPLASRARLIALPKPDAILRALLFKELCKKQRITITDDEAQFCAYYTDDLEARHIEEFSLWLKDFYTMHDKNQSGNNIKKLIFTYRTEYLHRPYRNSAQRVWDGATYSNVTAFVGLVATIAGIGKGAVTIAGWWKKDAPPQIDTPPGEKDDLSGSSENPDAPEAGA